MTTEVCVSIKKSRMNMRQQIKKLAETSATFFSETWFSYFLIGVLQCRTIWNIWEYRDLTFGDTSYYFKGAYAWQQLSSVNMVWSPLYTAFYGTFLYITKNPYAVTLLHRLVIVFILGILVLAVMRRLISPIIGWLISAWWSILPVYFDALYEVHLFVLIPLLGALCLVLYRPDAWGRGGALALMLIASILVRNEYLAATGVFALLCFAKEFRLRNKEIPIRNIFSCMLRYGLPLLLACIIILGFYSKANVTVSGLVDQFLTKQRFNVGQGYAFGYQQRHPEWNKNAWHDYQELMQEKFGQPSITFPEMLRKNFKAAIEHVWWNMRLAPGGIQLLLFNSMSGSITPDYIPVHSGNVTALVLSVAACCIVLISFFLLYNNRQFWWDCWLEKRLFAWLLMLSYCVSALIVIVIMRPRPSFLFPFGVSLLALIGMGVMIIVRRWKIIDHCLSKYFPLLALFVISVIPGYYPHHAQGRPLLEHYRRLLPLKSEICRPETTFIVNKYTAEINNYLCPDSSQKLLDYTLFNEMATVPFEKILELHRVNLVYVDEKLWTDLETSPHHHRFLNSLDSFGWEILAIQNTEKRWMVLHKISSNTIPACSEITR